MVHGLRKVLMLGVGHEHCNLEPLSSLTFYFCIYESLGLNPPNSYWTSARKVCTLLTVTQQDHNKIHL